MQAMLGDIDKGLSDMAASATAAAATVTAEMEAVKDSFMIAIEPLHVDVVDNTVVKGLQRMGTAVQDIVKQAQDSIDSTRQKMAAFGMQMANSFTTMFAQIIEGSFNLEEALINMLKKVLAQALSLLVVFGIMSAFTGGGFGAAVGGLGKFMGAGLGIPQFADGGIVSGPVIAQVGEYSGASHNPEVIAPLDKLQSMMGGASVQVTGKISGRDILLTSERNAIDRNRVRGF